MPVLAADDQTITAQDTFYDPPSVTLDIGDTVTLDNIGGTHNFHFSDGTQLPALPTANTDPAWPVAKTFGAAGTYSFFCDQHPTLMQGTVKVVDPNASPSPTPTATPTPTPPGETEPAAVEIRRLRLRGTAFCSRRSETCRRPGVALRINLSAPARVRGTLKRKRRAAGRIDLGTVQAGARTLRFGKRLKPGRYTLRLRVGTLPARTLRFRIRA
ncbi:MAG TPA: plastocyanin/azurin family copper-binding protein [Solirubrobacteraceae bacterium]|nr:plastocyanin/azurin family copper-binding protein [Solirubrobacteraceae bacterium]